MQKITPCLWFDNQLDDAISFYRAIFKNAGAPQSEAGPGWKGIRRDLRPGGPAVHGPERRPSVQVQ